MGINDDSAESRAEAAARRAEAAEEQRATAAQAQTTQTTEDPPLVSAFAVAWDPLGDDPKANHDDGRAHPDEDAIVDRFASHEAKREAWGHRADRLAAQGKVQAGYLAMNHMMWHGHRVEP